MWACLSRARASQSYVACFGAQHEKKDCCGTCSQAHGAQHIPYHAYAASQDSCSVFHSAACSSRRLPACVAYLLPKSSISSSKEEMSAHASRPFSSQIRSTAPSPIDVSAARTSSRSQRDREAVLGLADIWGDCLGTGTTVRSPART